MLFTNIARRRAVEWKRRAITEWKAQAQAAWEKLSRRFLAAWAAELDGNGDPVVTMRWQLMMARVRFYVQRCVAALAALGGAR